MKAFEIAYFAMRTFSLIVVDGLLLFTVYSMIRGAVPSAREKKKSMLTTYSFSRCRCRSRPYAYEQTSFTRCIMNFHVGLGSCNTLYTVICYLFLMEVDDIFVVLCYC